MRIQQFDTERAQTTTVSWTANNVNVAIVCLHGNIANSNESLNCVTHTSGQDCNKRCADTPYAHSKESQVRQALGARPHNKQLCFATVTTACAKRTGAAASAECRRHEPASPFHACAESYLGSLVDSTPFVHTGCRQAKFRTYGTVCCACAQRPGLPRTCHSG